MIGQAAGVGDGTLVRPTVPRLDQVCGSEDHDIGKARVGCLRPLGDANSRADRGGRSGVERSREGSRLGGRQGSVVPCAIGPEWSYMYWVY